DAADVIAAEIDEHDVLGALLRIGQQFGGEAFVLLLATAARARAGQGADRRLVALDADHDFRRRTDQAQRPRLQIEQERTRIDDAQGPVNVERPRSRLGLQALAEDDLEDVAGVDVLFATLDGGLEGGALEVRAEGQMDLTDRLNVGQLQIGDTLLQA